MIFLLHKMEGRSIVLPQEARIPSYGIYNPNTPHRAAGHPSTLVGSFLATRKNHRGAYSSVSPVMGMPASMVVPTNRSTIV
jgi:hypothetical protein